MLKLLDYDKPNPFGSIIGKPRKLAWPVNAYRVTLPKVSGADDGLNAFERVILKLLDAVGVMDADDLAAETRIPLDLVKGILLRLQDKELIDEHNAVIKQGRDEGVTKETMPRCSLPRFCSANSPPGKSCPFCIAWTTRTPCGKRKARKKTFGQSAGVMLTKETRPHNAMSSTHCGP